VNINQVNVVEGNRTAVRQVWGAGIISYRAGRFGGGYDNRWVVVGAGDGNGNRLVNSTAIAVGNLDGESLGAAIVREPPSVFPATAVTDAV